jgi:methylated-DNA-[protein]-cysteine S-methyltransferase
MNNISIQYFKSSFGELIIGSYNDRLCICDWRYRKKRKDIDARIQIGVGAVYVEEKTDIIKAANEQLNEYLDGKRTVFDLPILVIGSDFQKKVWAQLLQIPFGEKETYMSLSRKLNNEKAIRAVAAANGANAISIIIPCHRIVGSQGALVGYAGGLKTKEKLLALESKNPAIQQLDLFRN